MRVCVEGGGRLTQCAMAAPGPSAGGSAKDRAVTVCHLACGGALLVVGRACGAVEIHTAPHVGNASDSARQLSELQSVGVEGGQTAAWAGPELIRQLESGMDLAAASGTSTSGSSPSAGAVPGRYRLVGELGVHNAAITCLATDVGCTMLAVGDASGAVSVMDLCEGRMTFVTPAFHNNKGGSAEGVAAAAFCPSVVGIKIDVDRGGGGGGNSSRGDNGESAECDSGMGSPCGDNNKGGDDPAARARHNLGAEVLVLASSSSALCFLDSARGTPIASSTAMHPKTSSPALAIAPLTAAGVPPGSRRGGDIAAAFWFNGGSRAGLAQGQGQGQARSGDHAAISCCTAFVGVASAEALRVYPANGAARVGLRGSESKGSRV